MTLKVISAIYYPGKVHLFWENHIHPYLGVSKNFMFRPTMINIKIQSEKLVIKEKLSTFYVVLNYFNVVFIMFKSSAGCVRCV